MKPIRFACAAIALIVATSPAHALTIIDDFSQLGTVYQTSAGILSSTFVAGDTNVTSTFQTDAVYASTILGRAIGVPFTDTVTFTLANLASEQAVGDSLITSTYANGLPQTAALRIDTNLPVFVDATPANNSSFAITPVTASLGGGTVNVGRQGDAIAGTAAAAISGAYDLVTLFTHELEHSVAYSAGIPAFVAVAGNTGDANRSITIPSSLTGLPSSYSLPIVSSGSHIDGTVNSGEFNDAVVADPGFGPNQRALLTAAEIEGACVIDGCTAAQMNTDPYATVSAVPLPQSGVLMITALIGLFGFQYSRRETSSRS
jgi:hypothetical protein